jgi:hypothetical protein
MVLTARTKFQQTPLCFPYSLFGCNGQEVGCFRGDVFKWTKSRLFILAFTVPVVKQWLALL